MPFRLATTLYRRMEATAFPLGYHTCETNSHIVLQCLIVTRRDLPCWDYPGELLPTMEDQAMLRSGLDFNQRSSLPASGASNLICCNLARCCHRRQFTCSGDGKRFIFEGGVAGLASAPACKGFPLLGIGRTPFR